MIDFNRGVHNLKKQKMEYITFGKGEPLLIIPGIEDGLTTVGTRSMDKFLFYFNYGFKYNVIIASRGEPVKDGTSIKDMAKEYISLMESLGHTSYYVLGISMGGMIGQYMAYLTEGIKKLTLAVTVPFADDNLKKVISTWMNYANRGNYLGLKTDMNSKIYHPGKSIFYILNDYLLSPLYWPRNFERFLNQAKASYDFDARKILPKIKIPTFVLSGSKDEIMLPELGKLLAEYLPKSSFTLFKKTGHGAFDDLKYQFDSKVVNFLEND